MLVKIKIRPTFVQSKTRLLLQGKNGFRKCAEKGQNHGAGKNILYILQ
jgi:hypothetical protein